MDGRPLGGTLLVVHRAASSARSRAKLQKLRRTSRPLGGSSKLGDPLLRLKVTLDIVDGMEAVMVLTVIFLYCCIRNEGI